MDIYSFGDFDSEAVQRVREIDEERHKEEDDKDSRKSRDRETRLMFEQMLRGLYLGNPLLGI